MVNGSPTKTEMVDSAGGRSQIAQLTAAAIVVVVLLFLTGPLAYMPNAVLAAVVFLIGLRLVDYRGMADILRVRPGEFAVAAVTAATVVVVGVEQGIILAMALSIIEHIYHSYRPYDRLLTRRPTASGPSPSKARRPGCAPGLVVYRFGAEPVLRECDPVHRGDHGASSRPARPAAPLVRASSASAIADVDYSRRRLAPPGPRGARSDAASRWCCAMSTRRAGAARRLRPDGQDRRRRTSIESRRRRASRRIGQRPAATGGAPAGGGGTGTVTGEATAIDRRVSRRPMTSRPTRGAVARRASPRGRGCRGAQSAWQPAADRPDPVALLRESQAPTRMPDLVPVRYGRMSVSPFTFYRGAALPMAADLAAAPSSGIVVQLCGDAHLSNFGLFASPERDLLFDINDFDETLPRAVRMGPQATGGEPVVAARVAGFAAHDGHTRSIAPSARIATRMAAYATMRAIEVYYARCPCGILDVRRQARPPDDRSRRSSPPRSTTRSTSCPS